MNIDASAFRSASALVLDVFGEKTRRMSDGNTNNANKQHQRQQKIHNGNNATQTSTLIHICAPVLRMFIYVFF